MNDYFYSLYKSLDAFFKKNTTIIITVDISNDHWFEINYTIEISVNNKTFDFIIAETLNNNDKPYKLVYCYDNIYYFGRINIYNKIIEIITPELIIHEINEIEKLLAEEENQIESIDFQIKTAANLISKFSLPPEVALLCF